MTTYPVDLIPHATLTCVNAHAGQCRKGGDQPYALHPLRVAEMVRAHGASEAVIAAALVTWRSCTAIKKRNVFAEVYATH